MAWAASLPMRHETTAWLLLGLLGAQGAPAQAAPVVAAATAATLPRLEQAYADFNDELIPLGGSMWVRLAEKWLSSHPPGPHAPAGALRSEAHSPWK